MKYFYYIIVMVTLSSSAILHKYYVSVTEIEFKEKQKTFQFITRVYIDDFQEVLQKRYDESIILDEQNESDKVAFYITKYLNQKIKLKVNKEPVLLMFVGKEYEDDMLHLYIESKPVSSIKTLVLENEILFDLNKDQKNITHIQVGGMKKSFYFTHSDAIGVLKF